MSVKGMPQKFVDRVEDLKHYTKTEIDALQECCCPMVKDIYLNYQFEYWYDGEKNHLWEDDVHIYAVNEIPYCYDNDIGNVIFQGKLTDLVDQDKVWPFLLFINGHVVQWSRITIIRDYDYSYMRIDGEVDDYCDDAKIMYFPLRSKRIRYGEDEDYYREDDGAMYGLYFDDKGYLLSNPEFNPISVRLEFYRDDLYLNFCHPVDDILDIVRDDDNRLIQFPNIGNGMVPTLKNMVLFSKLGEFIGSAADNSDKISDDFNGAYATFVVDKLFAELDATIVQMYFRKHERSASHIYIRENEIAKNKLIEYMKRPGEDPLQLVRDLIFKPFDFKFSRDTSYYRNIHNAVKEITRYDFALWNEVFVEHSPVKSFSYSGRDFKYLADERSYVRYSRKHSDFVEDVVMMYVNGEIYEHSVDITYSNNTINIPAFDIDDDDVVEIVLFIQCNNNILDIYVPSTGEPVYVHPEYNLDDCFIMDEQSELTTYDVPDNEEGRKEYICVIDEMTKTEDGKYIIRFKDVSHYDKILRIVPKNQFRYYRYTNVETQYRIELPTMFNYCHDIDRYMIFVNGKKIDKEEYTVTIMNEYRPFDRLELYIATLLDKTDRVDIFYVPEYLKEKYKKLTTTMHGTIWLKTDYPKLYALSKETCMIFVNGRKINPLDIKDVDMNTILVDTKYNAIHNVTVVEYLDGSREVAQYLYGLEGALRIGGDTTYDQAYKTIHQLCGALTDNMTWYQNPKMPENLKTGIYSEDELGYSFMENPDNAPAIDYDADAETIGITDRSILPDWAKVAVDSQDECITIFNKESGFKAMMPDKMDVLIEDEYLNVMLQDSEIPNHMIVNEADESISFTDRSLVPDWVGIRQYPDEEMVALINLKYNDHQVDIGIQDLDFSKYLYDQWTLVMDTIRTRLTEMYEISAPIQIQKDEAQEMLTALGKESDLPASLTMEVDEENEMIIIDNRLGGTNPFAEMNVNEREELITVLLTGVEEEYQQDAISYIYDLFNTIAPGNLEPDYKLDYAPLKSILYDIVTDYYVQRSGVNTGNAFTYDFEVGQFDEDKLGNKDITLYPDQDKLLDYQLSMEVAREDDVKKDKTYYTL